MPGAVERGFVRIVLATLLWGGTIACAQGPSGETSSTADQLADLQRQLDELRQLSERIQGQIDAIRQDQSRERPEATGRMPAEPSVTLPELVPPVEEVVGPAPVSEAGTGAAAAAPQAGLSGFLHESTPVPKPARLPAHVSFEDGFKLESDDGRYGFSLRQLTQAEFVGVGPYGDRSPGGFAIPRQRLYFNTWDGERFEGYVVTETIYGQLTLLDAWLDARLGDGPKVRFGRMRVPFLEEMYLLGEDRLITPERSLFNSTLTLYRELGVMLHGGDDPGARTSYAVGLFNGPANGDIDFNQAKDVLGYFEFHPFGGRPKDDPLRGVEFVLSGQVGFESNGPPGTPIFTLQASPQSDPNSISVSPLFFAYRPNVEESGPRHYLGADANWYYKRLNLYSTFVGGRSGYIRPGYPGRISSPAFAWTLTGVYWLTGEEITDRRDINPLRPFRWKDPLGNPGAWQAFARYDSFAFGESLIDSGFTIPGTSAPSVRALDLGISWFPDRFVTVWMGFMHAWLGGPVRLTPSRTTDWYQLFTLRAQVFF